MVGFPCYLSHFNCFILVYCLHLWSYSLIFSNFDYILNLSILWCSSCSLIFKVISLFDSFFSTLFLVHVFFLFFYLIHWDLLICQWRDLRIVLSGMVILLAKMRESGEISCPFYNLGEITSFLALDWGYLFTSVQILIYFF